MVELSAAQLDEYADYLDELEKKDPDGYRNLMSQMGGKTNNGPLQFPGEKVMDSDGISEKVQGESIDVEPCFVVKTKKVPSDVKVFINICQSDKIPNFGNKTQLDENGKEVEGVHVPLSVGELHKELDKANVECMAYDVAVNPEVVLNCDQDDSGSFRHFLCELVLESIQNKYKIGLDAKYKLPKLKFRGNLPPRKHFIRKNVKAKIEVVAPNESVQKKTIVAKPNVETFRVLEKCQNGPRTTCVVKPIALGGSFLSKVEADTLYIELDVPLEKSMDTILIDASAEHLVVTTGCYADFELFLPYPIHTDQTKATFNTNTHILQLQCCIVQERVFSKCPDIGSKPWLVHEALDSGIATPEVPKPASDRYHLPVLNTNDTKVDENEVLPEDRFHQNDMVSQHILHQRQEDRQAKEKEAEEKQLERAKEYNIRKQKMQETGKSWNELYPSDPEFNYEITQQKSEKCSQNVSATATALDKLETSAISSIINPLAIDLLD